MNLEKLTKGIKSLAIVATPLIALTLTPPLETEAAGVHIHRDISVNKVWNGYGYNVDVRKNVSKTFNPSTCSPPVSRSRSVHVNVVKPRPSVYIGVPTMIVPVPIIYHPFPVPINSFGPRPIYRVSPPPIHRFP